MVKQEEKQIYFEQYKMLVESAEKVSDKRMSANNYFITINTGIVSLAGLILTSNALKTNVNFLKLIGILGILICIVWFFIVASYKQLNSGKFKLIHKLENKLPIKLYTDEWKVLGEGKSIWKYIPLSHIEIAVPCLFILFYLFLVLTKL